MSQHSLLRRRGALLAIAAVGALTLAGCTASGGGDETPSEAADSFSFSFGKTANDEFYEQMAAKYMEETGVDIEVIPIPSDGYIQALSTQLQAGNATDLFVATPGAGQANGVVRLAEAGLVEPLGDASAAIIPEGTEYLYGEDDKIYGQPTSLSANGLVWSSTAAADAGVSEFPSDFDTLLETCTDTNGAGIPFTVLAGAVPPNLGLLGQALAITRVYAVDPDWNEQRSAGDVTFADSGWKQVLEDFIAMKDASCFQDGAAGAGFDAITGGIVQGKALSAAIPGSAAAVLTGASQGKYELNVQAVPPAEGGDPWIIASPLQAWASNAKSDPSVKLAVQKFLDWAAEPENLVEFANLSGGIPVAGADPSEFSPQFAAVADLIADGSFSPEPNLSWPNPSVYDALCVGMQGLLTGQTDVDGVLASMDAAWDQ